MSEKNEHAKMVGIARQSCHSRGIIPKTSMCAPWILVSKKIRPPKNKKTASAILDTEDVSIGGRDDRHGIHKHDEVGNVPNPYFKHHAKNEKANP